MEPNPQLSLATRMDSPACWELGFQAWAQSTCPELSALEAGMATHSSILAWRIPRTEEPGRGSSVHGIFQARVLEWGTIAFSGEHFQR